MDKKNIKNLKTFSFTILGIVLFSLGTLVGICGSGFFKDKKPIYQEEITNIDIEETINNKFPEINKILTNQIVLENFLPNGKWYNKTEISSIDLQEYDLINSNAFDNIQNKITKVELPSHAMFDGVFGISWPNVELISVSVQQNKPQMLFEINGILFTKTHFGWSAKTILDRKKPQIITMPSYDDISNYGLKKYNVSSNFFDEVIFENVQKIIFDKNKIYPISNFWDNAFLNCNKLEEDFSIKLSGNVSFCTGSFTNTNIINFNLLTDPNRRTQINLHQDSISNNKLLSEVKIVFESRISYIKFDHWDGSIFNENNLLNKISIISKPWVNLSIYTNSCNLVSENDIDKNIEINIQTSYCELSSNLVSGIYNNVVLNLFTNDKDGKWYIEKNALVGIKSNQFKINTNLPKGFFDNSGLSNDQMAGINYINNYRI